MTIGSFILVKNENFWIGPHLANWLPHLDQMVFADGGSTDGTLETILSFASKHPHGHKIVVYNDDPRDLRGDYVRAFNAALGKVTADWAFFLHPDQIAENPEAVRNLSEGVAYSTHMRSFAGEPGGPLYEIKGRGGSWKNIHRTNLDLVYHGHYGAANEDVYPTAIVGKSREHFGADFSRYPYEVKDSGLKLLHFSDVRPFARRYSRMIACLENQKRRPEDCPVLAGIHPRVTLKSGEFAGSRFDFIPAEYPAIFNTWKDAIKETATVHV
jgi:glycosyltransferase involved in cell wall biosynthesis